MTEFGAAEQNNPDYVAVDTGGRIAVRIAVGSNFAEEVQRVANEANFGGFYKVYLNDSELEHIEDAPEKVEPGMRIAIAPYDKAGI